MHRDNWTDTGIKYIGTGTSHFQSQPYPLQLPVTDWEYELRSKVFGLNSGITVDISVNTFPNLLANKVDYLTTSNRLGMNMYRLSFDLGRLNPAEGEFDGALMAEYVRMLALARTTGHEPMVTLHHFTMPLWLVGRDKKGTITSGGWEHPDVLKHFRYATKRVVGFLSSPDAVRRALAEVFDPETTDRLIAEGLCRYFMPINEPVVTLGNGYTGGVFPPYQKGRLGECWHILHRMADAYGIMTDQLRSLNKRVPLNRRVQIGNGYNWQYFTGPGSSLLHWLINEFPTRLLEERVSSDFIGFHYYDRSPLSLLKHHPDDRGRGDFDVFGPVNPAGAGIMLRKMHASYPGKPIFVSEIGFPDASDRRRPYWLLETVEHIAAAAKAGVPVKGILYWSLCDNFEWQRGMTQKFGLFSEEELMRPLQEPSGRTRSWQMWQAIARQLRQPSDDSFNSLAALEMYATEQYRKASL